MNNENPETKMRLMNNGREGRKAKKKPLNQKDKLTRFKWPKDNDSKQSQRKRKKKKSFFLARKEVLKRENFKRGIEEWWKWEEEEQSHRWV